MAKKLSFVALSTDEQIATVRACTTKACVSEAVNRHASSQPLPEKESTACQNASLSVQP